MNYKHDFNSNDNCKSCITSSSDVYIDRNDCEVQVNITAERNRGTVIWGYVYDYQNRPLAGAFITLLKRAQGCGNEFKRICSTHSDRNGFYQFDLLENTEGQYRVVASKCDKQDKKCDKHNDCDTHERCNKHNHCDTHERCNKHNDSNTHGRCNKHNHCNNYERYYDYFNDAIYDNDTDDYNCDYWCKCHDKRDCRETKCNNICYY